MMHPAVGIATTLGGAALMAGPQIYGAYTADQASQRAYKTDKRNLKFQKQNLAWQKQSQHTTWEREDNATQRRAADLEAAGLSKTLAAGGAAQTTRPIQTQAPQQGQEGNRLQAKMGQQLMQTNLALQGAEVAKTLAGARLTMEQAKSESHRREDLTQGARLKGNQADAIKYDLQRAKDTNTNYNSGWKEQLIRTIATNLGDLGTRYERTITDAFEKLRDGMNFDNVINSLKETWAADPSVSDTEARKLLETATAAIADQAEREAADSRDGISATREIQRSTNRDGGIQIGGP